MSKRIVVPSLVGAVALGGIAVSAIATGGFASASTPPEKPSVENGSARYTAPSGDAAGSLAFTAKVSDGSGVRSLKVVAWPESSHLDPTADELAAAESATCEKSTATESTCAYTREIAPGDLADLPKGTWYVSVLATAEDGDTAFVPQAATFDVPS